MNIYILVEGEGTERQAYRSWVNFVNPNLSYVSNLADLADNRYFIIAGFGYPNYLERIDNAIEDVNTNNISRLVIAVDSEEASYEEKYSEISNHVTEHKCIADVRIVIQHFCFETWALGNRRIIGTNIHNPLLREFINFYNVTSNDPELLPPYSGLNRAQFAFNYLNLALRNQYSRLIYSKRKPHPVCNLPYFQNVKRRLDETGHIPSFRAFIDAFT